VILVDNGVTPADEMMATITRPIEEAMKDIPGALTVRSATGRGSAEVNVFFTWSADMVKSELYVLGRLSQIRSTLPATASTADVDPTSALAEIVDMDRLVVTAKIRTSDVSVLRPGQRADISPGRAEAPEQSVKLPPVAAATVSFIGADVDPANDTVTVRASLPVHSGLRPGQFVTLRVGVGEHRDRLAVPEDSVVTDVGSSNASIAVVKDNIADKVPVKLGIRDNGLVEIEGAGVTEGTVVVTGGAYSLPDHMHVRPISR